MKQHQPLAHNLLPDIIEAGCDEAGRGCLAGPVFAAAVILPDDFENPLLNDSKQLYRLPSPPRANPLPRRRRQGQADPHFERVRSGCWADGCRYLGKLPKRRRHDYRSRRFGTLHARHEEDHSRSQVALICQRCKYQRRGLRSSFFVPFENFWEKA